MNASQIKYAKNRAEAILSIKMRDIQDKFHAKTVLLSNEQKVQALRDGKFTILEEAPLKYSASGGYAYRSEKNWYNMVQFTDETSFDSEGLQTAQKELKEKFTKLMDELMLGDNEEALKLLADFERS